MFDVPKPAPNVSHRATGGCGTVGKINALRLKGTIPLPPPLQNRTANAGRSRFCAGRGGERLKQSAFRADDADLAVSNLDALGERAEMVAAVAAAVDPYALACRPGEPLDHLRRDGLVG